MLGGNLASCVDARRTNPVDSALTPAVTGLEAAVSDSAGAVALAWLPYEGEMPFDRYLVLRKVKGLEAVDTVAVVSAQDVISFVDTTAAPHRDYEYRVAVVNRFGFTVPSAPVAVRSFGVSGVELFAPLQVNARTGAVSVVWQSYRGRGFGGYEVWRRNLTFGEEARLLARLDRKEVGAWEDTTARPGAVYSYWIHAVLLGEEFDSAPLQVSFELPPAEITQLALSSDCACAQLSWSAYRGPRFAAYEVLRRAGSVSDSMVADVADPSMTSVADSLLEGNTEYFYRVRVSTAWTGIGVEGTERSGLFHGLTDERRLPAESDTEVQAIDLATDELDQVHAVVTAVSSTTARVMRPGVRLHLPTGGARTYLSQVVPDRLSPVRAAAGQGWVFAAVADTSGQLAVAGIAPDRTEAWQARPGPGRPAGLYLDEEHVVMVDEEGLLYRLRAADGQLNEVDEGLRKVLAGQEGLPLQDLVFVPGSPGGSRDQWFLLAPERSRHKVLSRIRVSPTIIGGGEGQTFDDGVGPGLGQTLNPLVLAHGSSRNRLVVVESRGLLQVLDAREGGLARHYITRWGTFGLGAGEFLVTPPTAVAVAVDSQGSIHVADAGARGGRIQTFAP